VEAIAKALRQLPHTPFVLAVSGGRDSMVLLHAFRSARLGDLSAVATFDHGTGAAAAEAVELVVRECLGRGIPVVAGRAPQRAASAPLPEAVLRSARWAFLRAVADERGATVVTAHTRDDQAETVAMRILRGASARGLAGMAAPTAGVARPLLGVSRRQVAAYAEAHLVPFVEDPSNAADVYLRNRVRTDLLRAAEAVRPGFAEELVALGERAARWRSQVARLVDLLGVQRSGDAVVVPSAPLEQLTRDDLAVVWPEIASRAGVVLDRRGVNRLADWSPTARAGQRTPLSGGATAERTSRTFVVRPGAGRGAM
jgi:tRNA(Ile)-lysidine synthase